jgi:hypothetical protein
MEPLLGLYLQRFTDWIHSTSHQPPTLLTAVSKLSRNLSLSLMLRPTVSRPVSLGIKHPSGAYDQIFITCVTVTVLFLWGALSDERSGLSFLCAASPCQRSHSRVRVPWDLRPYFTLSDLRLPLSRNSSCFLLYSLGMDHIENTYPNSSSIVASRNYRTDRVENTASQLLHCCVLRICCLAKGLFAEPFPNNGCCTVACLAFAA